MSENKPNIVFILSDDQGYYSLGKLKKSELKTPNLDKLWEEGIHFSQFFCASPVCSPARASILTGCCPSAHGVHDWIRAGNINSDQLSLSDKEKVKYDYKIEKEAIPYLAHMKTYTDILKENGYNCALSGKWHLGDSIHPQHGFTYWYTIGKGGCSYMDPDIAENEKISFPKEYVTDLITRKAIEFAGILAKKKAPFYLSVHYTAPHAPWDKENHPKKYLDEYTNCDYSKYFPLKKEHENATPWSKARFHDSDLNANFRGYEASITAMDEGIGRIIDFLKKEGVYENTIIMFTSDNGFNMGHHGFFGKGNGTYPMNMYEESIRVPFILSYSKLAKKNITFQNIYSQYDIFPSILDMADIKTFPKNNQPGKSFFQETLCGREDKEREAVVFDEYGTVRMIRKDMYKYVHRYPTGPHELYHLEKDPEEEHNLYDLEEYEQKVCELRRNLGEWFLKYSDASFDGTKEDVTGLGQLCQCGSKAGLKDIFYPWKRQIDNM